MHFLVPCSKLVSYFTSIKKAVTIIINFENIPDKNALFVKFKKKIINFRNKFDSHRPESAGYSVFKSFTFKNFLGGA